MRSLWFVLMMLALNAGQGIAQVSLVEQEIVEQAKKQHPGDREMQVVFIKIQNDSYKGLMKFQAQNVPLSVVDELKKVAFSRYPNDYENQLHLIENQTKAFTEIESFDSKIPPQTLVEIKSAAKAQNPNDYVKQLSVIKSKVVALRK